ncbi:hypothetical protein [Oleiagrimonas sp. C23AA]|uniref:YncE family protein n=1 Tax=Oleiagrimonas sp. C23AA TaxID=2719047 RepID=UPI00141ED093|nr:hypothetical protein [Oleiagrimonas sp. C23AA]NII11683.1 hypothetical protein [Oleiagrimonas sp. C23AA]
MSTRSPALAHRGHPRLWAGALSVLALLVIAVIARGPGPIQPAPPSTVHVGDVLHWRAPQGAERLLVAAPGGDALTVYDAASGAPLRRLGSAGRLHFAGIAALARAGSFVFVAERQNHRVQVLSWPALKPVAKVNLGPRAWPTDLRVRQAGAGRYRMEVQVQRLDGAGTRRLHVDWQRQALAAR